MDDKFKKALNNLQNIAKNEGWDKELAAKQEASGANRPSEAAQKDRYSSLSGYRYTSAKERFSKEATNDEYFDQNYRKVLTNGTNEEKRAFRDVYHSYVLTKEYDRELADFNQRMQSVLRSGGFDSADEAVNFIFNNADGSSRTPYLDKMEAEPLHEISFDKKGLEQSIRIQWDTKWANDNAASNEAALKLAVDAEKIAQVGKNGSLLDDNTIPQPGVMTGKQNLYNAPPADIYSEGRLWAGSKSLTNTAYERSKKAVEEQMASVDAPSVETEQPVLRADVDGTAKRSQDGYKPTEVDEAVLPEALSESPVKTPSMTKEELYAGIDEALLNNDYRTACKYQYQLIEGAVKSSGDEYIQDMVHSEGSQKATVALMQMAMAGELPTGPNGQIIDPDVRAELADYEALLKEAYDIGDDEFGEFIGWLDGVLGMDGKLIESHNNEGIGITNTVMWALDHAAYSITDLVDKFVGSIITGAGELLGSEQVTEFGIGFANEMNTTLSSHNDVLRENGTTFEILAGTAGSEAIKMQQIAKVSAALNMASAASFGYKMKFLIRMISSTPFAAESGLNEFWESYNDSGDYLTSAAVGLAASAVTAAMSQWDGILKNIEASGMPYVEEVVEKLALVPGSSVSAGIARWGKMFGSFIVNVGKTAVNEAVQEPAENIATELVTGVIKGENILNRDWKEYGRELTADALMGGLISICSSVSTFPSYANSVKVAESLMAKSAVTVEDVNNLVNAVAQDLQDPTIRHAVQDRAYKVALEAKAGEIMANGTIDGSAVFAAKKSVSKAAERYDSVKRKNNIAQQKLASAMQRMNENPSDTKVTNEVLAAVEERNLALEETRTAEREVQEAQRVYDSAKATVQETALAQARVELASVAQQNEVAKQERAAVRSAARESGNVTAMGISDFTSSNFADATPEERQRIEQVFREVQKEMAPGAQESRDRFMRQLTKKYGVQFDVVDTTNGGAALRYNGSYNAKTGKVEIDQNATQSDMLYGTVLHELTHRMEQSGGYQEFADALLNIAYADSDEGQLERDIEARRKRYNTQLEMMAALDPTVDAAPLTEDEARREIVADLTRKILYGDEESINRLVAEKPSVARRILETIKNFIGKLTGIAREDYSELGRARELFEKALYGNKTSKGKKRFKLNDYSEHQINNWSTSNSIEVYTGDPQQVIHFVENAIGNLNKGQNKKLYFGAVTPELASAIKSATGVDTEGFNLALGSYEVQKIFKDHGTIESEEPRGQRPVEVGDFIDIVDVVTNPDEIRKSDSDYFGKPVIEFVKEYDGKQTVVAYSSTKHKDLRVQTMYVNAKKRSLATPMDEQASINTPEASSGTAPVSSIPNSAENVNTKIQGENDNTIAEETPSGTITKDYSLASWTEKEKKTVRKKLLEKGFDAMKVERWIDDVSSVAATIAADKDRLDYEADHDHVMLKDNQEYKKTLDASTLCAKRLLYQGTFNEIQHQLPNTVITSDMLLDLLNMMKDAGYETPCGVCYVESRRRHLGKFAEQWLHGRPATKDQKAWEPYSGDYVPTLDELTTTDGLAKLKENNPEAYDDFIAKMNSLGSSNPKIVQLRTDYRGDIRKMTKVTAENIKRIGGLRVQSFSDFETPHLIDMMQAVLDMSSKGLTSQAYTKVPNFAAVFGDTGIKINLSLLAEGNGLDENGNLIFSSSEGMDFEEAMRLRERYSKNVGTIIVGANDAHIRAAMADPRIDFIIPFHRSGWGQNELKKVGVLQTYTDYQAYQNERMLDGSKPKGGNFYPIDYWDYDKTGDENAATYLRMCEKDGRIPKFEQFLEKDADGHWVAPSGYWKMLIDFKMYDNDGVGAPQEAVQPNFNMEEAMRVLGEYKGGANSLPVAQDIVERFVNEYKEQHPRTQYSLPSEDVLRDMVRQYMQLSAMGPLKQNHQPGESQFAVKTAPNSVIFSEETKRKLQNDPYYEKTSQKENINSALVKIDQEGYRQRRDKMMQGVTNLLSPQGQAEAYVLCKLAKEIGDAEAESAIAFRVKESGTLLAQSMAMRAMYTSMSPEGKLRFIQRVVDGINNEYEARGKNTRVAVPDWLGQKLAEAEGDSAQTSFVLEEAYRQIAESMPYSVGDAFDTWRYLVMLGNPMTHMKNLYGNMAFALMVSPKNKLEGAVQKLFIRDRSNRTKTAAPIKKKYRDFAKLITKAQRDALMGESMATEHNARGKIDEYRQKAPKWLDSLAKANSNLMGAEDLIFKNAYFSSALAGYLQARKFDLNNVDDAVLQSGIEYAMNEARKNTFNNVNKFAQTISSWSNGLKKQGAWGKIGHYAFEAILPFKNTPANILSRGIEYSPVGLMYSLSVNTAKLIKGKDFMNGNKPYTSADYLSSLSAGLTGSAAVALGMLLAHLGILHTEEEELEGKQENSIDVLGQNLTIDWAGTVAMPILMGGRMYEVLKGDAAKNLTDGKWEAEDLTDFFNVLMDTSASITDPMVNLSVLQGVKSMIESAGYGDNPLGSMISRTETTYASQFIPSVFGAIARTVDSTRRTTYTDKNSTVPSDIQYFVQSTKNKIPFLSKSGTPYLDMWGDEVSNGGIWRRIINNFLLPGYSREITDPDEATNLLIDLLERTNDDGVLPSAASKKFTVGGEVYNMSADEYVKYAGHRGDLMKQILEGLEGSYEYHMAGDKYKTVAVKKAYDFASQSAAHGINSNYVRDTWIAESTNPTKSVIEKMVSAENSDKRDEYKPKLVEAVLDGNYADIETYVEALRDAGASNGTLQAAIRDGGVKEKFLELYKSGRYAAAQDIIDAVEAAGVYSEKTDIAKIWLKK